MKQDGIGDHDRLQGTARFSRSDFEAIENWRRAQAKIPPFAEALRTLVKLGLTASTSKSDRRRGAAAATPE